MIGRGRLSVGFVPFIAVLYPLSLESSCRCSVVVIVYSPIRADEGRSSFLQRVPPVSFSTAL